MNNSLILRLPDIVACGHQRATQFLADLERRPRVPWQLQPRAVSPPGGPQAIGHPCRNHLVCADDLEALSALLAGHTSLPRLRGRVHLICFEPGPGTPAARGSATGQSEHERLAAFAQRLLLMRALLADTGFICVRLAPDHSHVARRVVDALFGPENNAQDILWHTPPSPRMASAALRHGLVHVYTKHRHRVEPVLPLPAASRGRSSTPAEAMLRHLLAVSTAPGDTVVAFNAGAEIAKVAAHSARQWILTAPDGLACDALHPYLSNVSARPFLRQALATPG